MCFHTLTNAMVGMAQVLVAEEGDLVQPDALEHRLTMPIWKSSIQNHSSATTTLAMRYGSRIEPRMILDLVSRCMSTARPRATTVWKPMLSTTY